MNTILKKITILFSFLVSVSYCNAQDKEMKGNYYNQDLHIMMKLSLDKKNIPVPGLEVDSCYGYIHGNINGLWAILKVKSNNGAKAVVRAISERGADAQDLEIEAMEDAISVKMIDGTYIKGVANGKYVKLPKPMILTR